MSIQRRVVVLDNVEVDRDDNQGVDLSVLVKHLLQTLNCGYRFNDAATHSYSCTIEAGATTIQYRLLFLVLLGDIQIKRTYIHASFISGIVWRAVDDH